MGQVKLNRVLKGRCPVCHFEEFHLVSCQLGQFEDENARLRARLHAESLLAAESVKQRDRFKALAERREEQARVEESDLRMVAAHLELLDRPGVSDYLVDALLIMRRVLAARAAIEEKKHG
ncbi:hypothetical protein LCGC14_2252280 [marine sediment metagenome]|uniref:Uncharacterized protein n=1 Tax=marine sediment metagenome TaxID=412755 RepID=A0A0F9DPR8_9ZZZZ